MGKAGWFFLGALSAATVILVAGALFLRRAGGFSTRLPPSAIERWVARRARAAALPREARGRINPVPDSPEALAEARRHWADHCAVCHANNGSGNAEMGRRMYPPAPDMRLKETQKMTDGELFYIIQNGIRMSGMPAWGGSDHDEQDSWRLVRFIRHLPQITLREEQEMEKLNPKSPEERKEEQEENEFLSGAQPHEHTPHKHP
jgi:mono/diheme cytochrome c family protein